MSFWAVSLSVYVVGTLFLSFLMWNISGMSSHALSGIKREFQAEKSYYRPKVIRAHSWWCRCLRVGLVFGINALMTFSIFRHGNPPALFSLVFFVIEIVGVVILIHLSIRRYHRDLEACRQIRDTRPKDQSIKPEPPEVVKLELVGVDGVEYHPRY